MKLLWQHQRARNDVNGNVKRLYIVWNQNGRVLHIIEEGYAGIQALANVLEINVRDVRSKCVELTACNINTAEYYRMIRWGEDL